MQSRSLTFLTLAATVSVFGCSKEKATTISATAPDTVGNAKFNSAVADVSSAFAGAGAIMPSVAASASSWDGDLSQNASVGPSILSVAAPPSFNDAWDVTTLVPHPACSGGSGDPHCAGGQSVTLKTYLAYQVDPDAVRDNGSAINVFGRLKASISQICAIMNAVPNPDANGYPADGASSVTVTARIGALLVSKCGMSADDVPEGAEIQFTVSTPADTTLYDKSIALDDGEGSVQTYRFRTNAAAVNIQSVEVNDEHVSRSLVMLDRATGKLRAEYASGGTTHDTTGGGSEFNRVFYDPTTDTAAVFSYGRDQHTPNPNQIAFTLIGHPAIASDEAAVSLRAGQFGGFTWASDTFNACFVQSTGVKTLDGSVSCTHGATGVAVNASGPNAVITDIDSMLSSGSKGAKLNNATEASGMAFTTAADIYTALLSHGST